MKDNKTETKGKSGGLKLTEHLKCSPKLRDSQKRKQQK